MICCVRDRNAEALRTQSSCSIVSSAFSASLRFKPPCSRKDGGLDPRVSHSISRVPKTAVGDPRQHAKAGLCLAGGGGMSRLWEEDRNAEALRTQSCCPSISSALSASPRFKSFLTEIAEHGHVLTPVAPPAPKRWKTTASYSLPRPKKWRA